MDADPQSIATCLQNASPEYVRFFQPFEFSREAIAKLVGPAKKDQWFAIEIQRVGMTLLAGFYMLRGLDEGFIEPMYGVFIAQNFAGLGLARMTLSHAEAMCRLNEWPSLLLKVDPENQRAFALYAACGFRFLRLDPANGNQVLIKHLSTPVRLHSHS